MIPEELCSNNFPKITINTKFYKKNVLIHFYKKIARVWPALWKHWSTTIKTLQHTPHGDFRFSTRNIVPVLVHLLYLPDLKSPECFLFLKSKIELKGDHSAAIGSNQEFVIKKFKEISKTDFLPLDVEKLKDRASNCKKCNGHYFK